MWIYLPNEEVSPFKNNFTAFLFIISLIGGRVVRGGSFSLIFPL